MSTRPCPNCHEIIPADLDYCPYCNESTKESLQTPDDIALSQQHQAAAASTIETLPPDSYSEQAHATTPARPVVDRCIMCNMAPSTVGDYCLDCRNKLDMGPEQWDLVKQDAGRRNAIIAGIVVVILLVLIVAVARMHHRHTAPRAAAAGASSASTS